VIQRNDDGISNLQLSLTGWQQEPDSRPTFAEIKKRLDGMFSEPGTSLAEEVERTLTIERGMSLDPAGPDAMLAKVNGLRFPNLIVSPLSLICGLLSCLFVYLFFSPFICLFLY
jgi:hypothetical protein